MVQGEGQQTAQGMLRQEQSGLSGHSARWNEMAGRLMIPLDYADAGSARTLIEKLEGIPLYMKVGMQLFYAAGPDFVKELKERGYSVFLDVKMHDIPNTVRGGAASVTRLGVDMFNVHASGGAAMMEAALEGATQAVDLSPSKRLPLIIAVTQLTSTSRDVMNAEIGIPGNVEDTVVRYAKLAASAGLHGVVASPQESAAIAAACGPEFRTVTPGIRPAGASLDDQSRVMTPGQAIRQGSHYLVVGRPITAAPDPRQAALTIIEEMIEA